MKRKKRKKSKLRTATIALLLVAVFLLLFTVAQIVCFCLTGQEQTQLIESVYTVCGIELGGLLLKRVLDKAIPIIRGNED